MVMNSFSHFSITLFLKVDSVKFFWWCAGFWIVDISDDLESLLPECLEPGAWEETEAPVFEPLTTLSPVCLSFWKTLLTFPIQWVFKWLNSSIHLNLRRSILRDSEDWYSFSFIVIMKVDLSAFWWSATSKSSTPCSYYESVFIKIYNIWNYAGLCGYSAFETYLHGRFCNCFCKFCLNLNFFPKRQSRRPCNLSSLPRANSEIACCTTKVNLLFQGFDEARWLFH